VNPGTSIRAVAPEDWPAIWRFMRRIVAAGETFSWERDISEEEARARWCHEGANPRPPDLVCRRVGLQAELTMYGKQDASLYT
jgi:hypothetical protein